MNHRPDPPGPTPLEFYPSAWPIAGALGAVALLAGGAIAWAFDAPEPAPPVALELDGQADAQAAALEALDAAERALHNALRANHRAQDLVEALELDDPPTRPPDGPPARPPGDRPPGDRPPSDRMSCDALREMVVDVDRSRWQVVDSGPNSGDGLLGWSSSPAGQVWRNVTTYGGFRASMVVGKHSDPPAIDHVRDGFELTPGAIAPGTWWDGSSSLRHTGQDTFQKMIWGANNYDHAGVKWLRGWIHGIPKEHGIYEHLYGAAEYGWLFVEDCGGQALQIVSRPIDWFGGGSWKDAENRPFLGGELIWIHDLCSHNNGHGRYGASGGGASFPISLAFNDQGEAGHAPDVLLERFHVFTFHDQGEDATGAVLIGGSSADRWTWGDVVVRDGLVELGRNNRAPFKLEGAESILVERVTFDVDGNGRIELDQSSNEFPSGRIVWRDNVAGENVVVRYGGELLGPATGNYLIVNGVVQR